jgi:hypothetical protein
MSDKKNKKFRRILRQRAEKLFTDFMDEVQVMTFGERLGLAIKIIIKKK